MEIKYKLEEIDFLGFQLFTASKSNRIMKKRRNGWVQLTLLVLIIGIYFYQQDNVFMSGFFGLVGVVTGIFYPKYFNWRYKKHYSNFIKDNYRQRVGEVSIIDITKEYVYSKGKAGESKILLKEIDEVSDTMHHFFLKISSGQTLIIPKREIEDVELLRVELELIGLKIIDELDWEWK